MRSFIVATLMAVTIPVYTFGFGAIAVDDEVGDKADNVGYYISTGEASKEEAQGAAMKGCKEYGNKNCRVAGWFKECGAYATSKDAYGYGFGSSQEIAINKALEECGSKNCRLVVSDCE